MTYPDDESDRTPTQAELDAMDLAALTRSSTESHVGYPARQTAEGPPPAALVRDAGQTMASTVEAVDRVAGLIHDIARATQEQSQGVSSVHGSVSELDGMTQQNASMVEESAAAASSLKDQAESLARVVGRFRVDD